MKRKIIALMAVIPLILLFTVFSVSGMVSLAINIPVASITIENKGNGVVCLDSAYYPENSFKLDVHVNPLNAYNKGYVSALEALDGGETSDVLSVDGSGRVKLNGKIGRVKLTCTSNDGGYTDSVIIIATSSKVLTLSAEATTLDGEDFVDTIQSGEDFKLRADVYPLTAQDRSVLWSSSDESVVKVNSVTGLASALTSGTATLTATCEDSAKGKLASSVDVTVTQAATAAQITVNGKDGHTVSVLKSATKLSLYLETPSVGQTVFSCDNPYLDCESGIEIENLESTTQTTSRARLLLNFAGLDAPDALTLNIKNGENESYALDLDFVDIPDFTVATAEAEIAPDSVNYTELNCKTAYTVFSAPEIEGLSYIWTSSDTSVLKIAGTQADGNIVKLASGGKTGESLIIVSAYKDGIYFAEAARFTVMSKQTFTDLIFAENSNVFGLAREFSVGDLCADGNIFAPYSCKLNLFAMNNLTEYNINDFDLSLIDFSADDPQIAAVETRSDGYYLDVKSSGRVTLTATWRDGELFGKNISESLTLNCVKDGVNVFDYDGLRSAAKAGKKIVLQNDVAVGKNLKGMSTEQAVSVLQSEVDKLYTTADDSYYMSTEGIHPTVNFCVEFKNDVFGNGFKLNANNITNYNDGSARISDSVFGGPLNMVNLVGVASVKAQDNIVFLIRTDGVTLNNIELSGCDDVSDLTELNNVGTTVEVLSSGVSLKNCRVKNGRTVLRYFGEAYDGNASASELKARPKSTLDVESCVLSCAREFIMKIGCNAAVKNDPALYDWSQQNSEKNYAAFAPKLTAADGTEYDAGDDGNINDSYFTENYIKTEVTLKNSVLATSGLFSVGIESKFAGPLLFGYKLAGVEFEGWSNLAGTSFSALLKLEGDVRFYDWKNLKNIDSSTLIEVDSQISGNYAALSVFNLDIGKMVEDVSAANPEYSKLLLDKNGEKYAHGGIALYGGGYNYGAVDMSAFTGEALKTVNVDMDVNETLSMLKIAAGDQPFRFLMYGNDSSFNLSKQTSDMSSGAAYSWIPPAV